MWNCCSRLPLEIWVLLGHGMLSLNRRSVNKDNCRGDEYGGRVAAAGRRLKEEDLGLSVQLLRHSQDSAIQRQCRVKWIGKIWRLPKVWESRASRQAEQGREGRGSHKNMNTTPLLRLAHEEESLEHSHYAGSWNVQQHRVADCPSRGSPGRGGALPGGRVMALVVIPTRFSHFLISLSYDLLDFQFAVDCSVSSAHTCRIWRKCEDQLSYHHIRYRQLVDVKFTDVF